MSDDVDSERFNKSVDELTMESLKNANYVSLIIIIKI